MSVSADMGLLMKDVFASPYRLRCRGHFEPLTLHHEEGPYYREKWRRIRINEHEFPPRQAGQSAIRRRLKSKGAVSASPRPFPNAALPLCCDPQAKSCAPLKNIHAEIGEGTRERDQTADT
jgi:hypothetical protein